MLKVSALAGLVLGLGIAAVSTYQPARQPVAIPQRYQPQATLPTPATLNDGEYFSVWVEGREFKASKYANDIPYLRIGNTILSTNGNIGRGDN